MARSLIAFFAATAVAGLAVGYALGQRSSPSPEIPAGAERLAKSSARATGAASARVFSSSSPGLRTGSVEQTDKTWVCDSPVNLDLVSVTMTPAAKQLARLSQDAIHLGKGCTGRIGRIEVVQNAADGIKVGSGARDVTIASGSIRCVDKAPVLHQDGVQVMGGSNILFQNLSVDCGRHGEGGVNSNFFVNQGLGAAIPPSDIVCDHCWFGGGAAHTVSIQSSVRSGVRDSTLCVANYPKLTLAIGKVAVDPVNDGNKIVSCGAGGATGPVSTSPARPSSPASAKITIAAATATVTYQEPLVLSGKLSTGKARRHVFVFARPAGASAPTQVADTRTDETGQWQATVHPAVETTYTARVGSNESTATVVRVRPKVVLAYRQHRLTVKVLAVRPLTGQTIYFQRLDGTRWRTFGHAVLGPASGATFTLKLAQRVTVRASLPATSGYLGATTEPVAAR